MPGIKAIPLPVEATSELAHASLIAGFARHRTGIEASPVSTDDWKTFYQKLMTDADALSPLSE
jgi:hypothetical protein